MRGFRFQNSGSRLASMDSGIGNLPSELDPDGSNRESDRLGAALAGPDPDAVVHRQDEDLAIADLAVRPAPARLDDRVDRRLDEVLVDGDLQLDLPEQVHRDLVPPINLGVTLLTPEPLDVGHGEPEDLDLREGFLDRFELGGLDDRDDQLHGGDGTSGRRSTSRRSRPTSPLWRKPTTRQGKRGVRPPFDDQ